MLFQLMETDGVEESWPIGNPQEDKKSAYKLLFCYKNEEWLKGMEDVKFLFKKADVEMYDWWVHFQSKRLFYIKQVD